ncbi:MAG: DUF1828 domain-containing protein [Beijerinckiaceae bacterium]|nr:DUF1828 domain-containing protein [Beijerinckiaceae bacterium]
MKQELCRAFCEEVCVKNVPIGLAISTPFRRADGDAIGFYVVKNKLEPGLAHLEDDGTTIPYLEAAGIDFETQTRQKAFASILEEYGAQFDEDEMLIRTPDVPEQEIPRVSLGFAALLLRLFDFLLLTQERVESAFREDAKKRIREAIGDQAKLEEDEIVSPSLAEVTADLVIRAQNRIPVAVFLAQSPQRVNDAIFLQMAAFYEAHHPLSVIAMIESDQSIPAKLRQRAANRLTAVPIFRNDEDQAVRRVVREAIGLEAALH